VLVLDTSLLLGGKEPPRTQRWATTPEAQAEISPGGKDARRFQQWLDTGLQIRSAPPTALGRIEDTAMSAGNLGRLSDADLSLLALAWHEKATLVSDDMTLLDIAMRLKIKTQTINHDGIATTKNWKPRCKGCGRWFEEQPKDCPICGSEVVPRPLRD
jgi:UPF0271 protein